MTFGVERRVFLPGADHGFFWGPRPPAHSPKFCHCPGFLCPFYWQKPGVDSQVGPLFGVKNRAPVIKAVPPSRKTAQRPRTLAIRAFAKLPGPPQRGFWLSPARPGVPPPQEIIKVFWVRAKNYRKKTTSKAPSLQRGAGVLKPPNLSRIQFSPKILSPPLRPNKSGPGKSRACQSDGHIYCQGSAGRRSRHPAQPFRFIVKIQATNQHIANFFCFSPLQ